MASSQPTSPVRSPSPDRFELSPASKLKKLLAAVDSDSDNDGSPKPAAKKSQFLRRASPSTSHRTNDDAPGRDSGEDEDEDEDVRPRGRLASRMQGGTAQVEEDAIQRVRKLLQKGSSTEQVTGASADSEMADADDDEDDDDMIRPRGRLASRMQGEVKASVGSSPAKTPISDQPLRETQDVEMAEGGVDDNNQDDDTPVRPRKLKSRQRRSKTPESTAATPQREASPGLFVTPTKSPASAQASSHAEESGSDADLPALKSDRFKALVEKKRKERLAREAEEARKREARAAAMEDLGDDNEDDVSDITDDEGGRKLTQTQKSQTRPSRKASKKAMEEMNRETQRIQRAMQLAHEAKTRKKITKASLFERFNFNPSGNPAAKEKLQSSSRAQTPTSTKSTDAEMKDAETPPSSPPARVEDVLGKNLNGLPSQSGVAVPGATTARNKEGQDDDEDFPDLMDMKAFARKPLDKEQTTATTPELQKQTPTKPAPKRHVRVKLPPIQANKIDLGSDDDGDDLVVLDANNSKLDAMFERVPKNKSKESSSLFALRRLAHLDDPERKAYKKTDKAAMNPGELQAFLNQRAREQARLEKERRVEMLKAKGIHIQTEEERERDREQIEDMVARARREAEEIMDRERDAAKKERKAAGKDDPLAWDDSGTDDDYEEPADEDEDGADAEVELSGSEQEEEDEEGMIVDGNDDDQEEAAEPEAEVTPNRPSAAQALVDEDAEEDTASEASESEKSWIDPEEEEERHRWGAEDDEETPAFVQARRPKKTRAVISDDEDSEVEVTPKAKIHNVNFTPAPKPHAVNFTPGPNNASPDIPTSVLRSANKSFIPGLPVDSGGPAGLGLTQIFAGTMDSQTGPFENSPSQPMPTFDNFPDSQFSQNVTNSADGMILDSQPISATQQAETQQNGDKETQIQLDFTQSQTHGLDSLLRDDVSQASQMMPTQDGGFQNWTPLKERFVEKPPATVETVVPGTDELGDMAHQSPLLHKRGRLRRKVVVASDSEDEDDEAVFGAKPSAFNVLKDAAAKEKRRQAKEEFDRKKSKAKDMVEEQAEESEDEYAGLGGVDGEYSDDDAASVHEMIDDNTQGNKGDETKLAAFFADRERADDEKQVDKLFKDITTGMLRRKRGADYDLSDSDDGGEARRRMKRRQFAKMQKALFTDERVSKVAENPRNQAFLRTIEDVGSDDEMDFLFEPPPPAAQASKDSQQSSNEAQGGQEQATVPDSQPTAAAAAAANMMSAPAKRAPASNRRTRDGRKPSNIGEIRETLSNLLDEPSGNTVISATDPGSDSDGDEGGEASSSNKENANPRRTRHAGPVVDRISLKRQGSSNMSNASGGGGGGGGGNGRLAFAAPSSSAGSGGGFRVPALLRKATTNSLMGSAGSGSGVGGAAGTPAAAMAAAAGGGGGSAGGFGEEAKIKRNAGKRSGISYLARENDRRAAVQEAEKRREQRKFRAVEGRSKVVGGLFGAGKFE
ncbi:hypothetical protein VMCG_07657 [Cytospora schulzeri]|uniref:DNA replication checkpoint mediator MRC1 domain-containing protein n=1 Tax=Cytospora schulzeri TaxID=448051 RepID=A0A423VYZ1_9PEZI|nr:hypothetical protein VMCG_07657 [Valsa malicola]